MFLKFTFKAMLFDVFKFYIQDVILYVFCNIFLVNFIFMTCAVVHSVLVCILIFVHLPQIIIRLFPVFFNYNIAAVSTILISFCALEGEFLYGIYLEMVFLGQLQRVGTASTFLAIAKLYPNRIMPIYICTRIVLYSH